MAEEGRLSLSTMLYKNIKDNKGTLMSLMGFLVLVGLYVTNPALIFSASSHIEDDLGIFQSLLQNIENNTFELPPKLPNVLPVRFNFTSIILPKQCYEKNVIGLGKNVFLSICSSNNTNNNNNINDDSNVIIDIRKFTGDNRMGIKPTIVGINLNIAQWNVIKSSATIIDEIVIGLSISNDIMNV